MDKIFINIQEENEMIRELFKDKGSTSFVTLDEVFDYYGEQALEKIAEYYKGKKNV